MTGDHSAHTHTHAPLRQVKDPGRVYDGCDEHMAQTLGQDPNWTATAGLMQTQQRQPCCFHSHRGPRDTLPSRA